MKKYRNKFSLSLSLMICVVLVNYVMALTDDAQTLALWHLDNTYTGSAYSEAREIVQDDDVLNWGRDNDLIGGRRAAGYSNAEPTLVTDGVNGNALSFDGNDHAWVNDVWTNTDTFKIELNFCPVNVTTEQSLVGVVQVFDLRFELNSALTQGRMKFVVWNDSLGVHIAYSDWKAVSSLTADWSSVTAIVDVDGNVSVELEGTTGSGTSTTLTTVHNAHHATVYVGAAYVYSRPFTGLLDEIKISDLSLDPCMDDWQTTALWHAESTVTVNDKYSNSRSAIADDDSLDTDRDNVLILGNRANPHDSTTVPTVAGGLFGNALSFDGGDIAYAEDAWAEQDDFILEFYYYPTTFAADAELVTVTSAFSIRQKTTGVIYAYVYDEDTSSAVSAVSPAATINQWNHVLVEVINGAVDITVNGVSGTSATFSGDIQASYSPEIYVGSTWTGTRKFTGLFDEIKISDVTYDEVEAEPITQTHPRLLISSDDVADIQYDIANQVDPRYSAWLNLKARADAWCDDTVSAAYTGTDSSLFYDAAKGAGHLASKMALAYLLNGDTDHADKAKEILLEWAQSSSLPATNFSETIRFPNSGMETVRGVIGFILTYDYIYNYSGFTASEKSDVEDWFRAVLPSIQDGIDRWDANFKVSGTDPRGYEESTDPDDQYFGSQFYQNHLVAHTLGYLYIGYAIGDMSLVQFALDSHENPRDYLELFDGVIMMENDPDICDIDTQNPAPQDGEIYDRYRHVQNTGLSYAHLTLFLMTSMTETLFANGHDFYSRIGENGENLEYSFDFYADFWRLADASIKGGFYTGESISSDSWQISVFEVANKRYPGNSEIEDLLDSVTRGSIDTGGYIETYFCYPVLTHGVN